MRELLAQEYRGNILECDYYGHICGVTDNDEIRYRVGDADFLTFFRSSAKPIQAIPIIKHGVKEKYGITDEEFAIFTASHRAQDFHIKAIKGIMDKTGIAEENFVCLPTYPLSEPVKEKLISKGMPKSSIYHNCSGKHLGIMLLCMHLGSDIGTYYDENNPAQKEILDYMSEISTYPKEEIGIGIDGCGVPVFAMPLKYLAKSYLRLACPDLIEDEETARAVKRITGIMNGYPHMVSATDYICPILLGDDNIVAKGGAKGVYCFALRDERLGFAIKVMDGSELPWQTIIASILEQIDYKNKETIKRIYEHYPNEIVNDNNRVIGERKPVFKL